MTDVSWPVAQRSYITQFICKPRMHILSILGCLGVGLRPDSIMAQISCNESAPPTEDMLAINCTLVASRSNDSRVGDVEASVNTPSHKYENMTHYFGDYGPRQKPH